MISYYSKEDAEAKIVELTLSGFDKTNNKISYKLLDNEHNMEFTRSENINGESVTLHIKMEQNTVMLLEIE